jgi:PAS domain S-box-containing protein
MDPKGETGPEDLVAELAQALEREQALGRIRDQIALINNPGELQAFLDDPWLDELRGMGVPAYTASIQVRASVAEHFVALANLPRQAAGEAGIDAPVARYPWVGQAWETHQPVVVGRAALQAAGYAATPVQALVEVPLPDGGGSFGVTTTEPQGFGPHAVHAVTQVAGLLAVAVQRVRHMLAIETSARELRRRSDETDRLFSTAIDLLCIADTAGHFVRVNPEWQSTLGYTVDELNGTAFLDLVHPDDLAATRAALVQLRQGHEIRGMVNRYRHRDGSYRWIEWRAAVAGSVVYAAARDISERKRDEDVLRDKLQELERMNRLMAGRELRMIGLKREINDLCRELGRPERYHTPQKVAADTPSDS